MWFVSGIVMMYWDYPGVGPKERLARAPRLEPSRIRLTPMEAYRSLQLHSAPDQARLVMFDGRPAYRFRSGIGQYLIYADDGRQETEFSSDQALRTAAAWTGQPASAAHFAGPITEEDQWTVSGAYYPLRPLWKYTWPDGQEVYVSSVTGEVVQHTTRGSRIGAYFGAIPHWLYFTPLRKNQPMWSNIVIWLSGVGALNGLFGLVIGAWMYSSTKRYGSPGRATGSPYRGQKRWHHVLGLVFGLIICTWAFSGMLSMDPFDWESRGETSRFSAALRGQRFELSAFASKPPSEALAAVAADLQVKELNLTSFRGEPVYLAIESPQRSRIIPIHGEALEMFSPDRIAEALAEAALPRKLAEVRIIDKYDAYYLDRNHDLPLPVLLARLNDAECSTFYVDLRSARIVKSYVTRSRWNRWLYHGLHSFDFPWLYRYRPAWDILVLALLLGGTTLSITSLVIAWQLLRHKLIPNG
jgi:hypothetical protein